MYSTCSSCVNSTVYSIPSKGSLSNCFDERPIFLNRRCNGNNPLHLSSSCSSCCVCYAFPTHTVPVAPTLFYGPSQSTLLQCSISRSLMMGGRNRFSFTLPGNGRVLDCYEVPFSITDARKCHCSEGRRYIRSCCMISDSDCEFDESDGFDEGDIAEAMISLIRQGFGHQGKNSSSKRVEVGNQRISGAKGRNLSSSRRVELEKRVKKGVEEKGLSSFGKIRVDRKRESDREERKTNQFGSLNSKQNNKVGSIAVELRKNGYRLNGDQVVHSRDDSQGLRKEGSTCSSYYSLSSTGDIENDAEVEDKNVQFVEESSSGYRYDSVSDVGDRLDEKIKKEFKRNQGDNEKGREDESVLGDTTVGNRADWHLRKNSEKKLSEVSTRVTSSASETSEMNSRLSRTRESGYVSTSSSKKKFVDKEDELEMAVTLNEQSKQYDVSGKKVGGVFINEGKKLAEASKLRRSNTEEISRSQKRLAIKNENLELDASLIKKASNNNQETVRPILQEKSSRRSSSFQQLLGVSENRKTERERISHQTSQSDASESTDVHVTSNQEVDERHHQSGNHAIGEVDSRQIFLHLGVLSVIKEGNTNTSVSSSEIRTQNVEQNAASFNASNLVAKDIKSTTDKKASQRVISRKGSRDGTNISVVRGTDKTSATYSEKTSENRIFKQESNKTVVEKTVKETIIRNSQSNDRVAQTESGKVAKNHVEKSKFQGSINLSSQSSYQRTGVNEEENKSSEAVLMPPPSQLVARDPLRIDSTGEMASQVVSRRTSRSSSGASYMESGESPALRRKSYRGSGADESTGEPIFLITPDDTLGSADRLERSSAQFVGEFIEKSRNELLISEIQKEENISEVDIRHEEKHDQKNSVDYQMKDHDSRLSSGSSGTKGPSDEMWHVMDSTTGQLSRTDDPGISAHSENAIVKRSGKSLWNVISDIVRLRWNSRAETSDSALRSGARTSPNESVSNETWYSGREHEETDNTKMGRTTVSEFTSSGRMEEPNPSAHGQDLSDDKKAKGIYYEVGTPSSPNVMETEPSGGTLLVAGEEILTDGRKVDVISSGLDIERSSLPLSRQSIRRSPIIEEISHSGKNDAFASSSAEQWGHSSDATLPEKSTTGTKDGEVKQRKLQRNKQVPKDQFDEWEEAYMLETEQRKMDEMFMREALAEAKKAADTWEVPVGAVLVKHGKIIARGYNLVEELRDSTAHAEMICIREASKQLKTWRLSETTLYVTLEPCPMCAGAILQARIENLVWGAPNKLLGADGSWIRLFPDGGEGNVSEQSEKPAAPVHPFHPKMVIRRGVLASECADVMQQFFQLRRRKKQKKENTPPLTIAHHPSKFITKMHNIFHILFCL